MWDHPMRCFWAGNLSSKANYPCGCQIHRDSFRNLSYCFSMGKHPSLMDRVQHFCKGSKLCELYLSGNLTKLDKVKKDDMIDELFGRGIFDVPETVLEIREQLKQTLKGQSKPPAVCNLPDEKKCLELMNRSYQFFYAEPLHDFKDLGYAVIEEILACDIMSKTQRSDLQNIVDIYFKSVGSSRSFSKFRSLLLKVYCELKTFNYPLEIQKIIRCILSLVQLCYSGEHKRTAETILRFYNESTLLGYLLSSVIGKPRKSNTDAFYGNHFHSITVHLAECYRVISLKSLCVENGERLWKNVRDICKGASNHHLNNATATAFVRLQAVLGSDVKKSRRSDISVESNFLCDFATERTVFPSEMMSSAPNLIIQHLKRISDFLSHENYIIHPDKSIEFMDSPNDSLVCQNKSVEFAWYSSLPHTLDRVHHNWELVLESNPDIRDFVSFLQKNYQQLCQKIPRLKTTVVKRTRKVKI